MGSFFPWACTSEKILLGLQMCERSECVQQAATYSKESPAKRVSFDMPNPQSSGLGVFLFYIILLYARSAPTPRFFRW